MSVGETHKKFFEQLDESLVQYLHDDIDTFNDYNSESELSFDEIVREFSYVKPRYEKREVINQGGSKKIILAYDRFTQRTVALATLKEDSPNNSTIRDFIREAQITASLQHPNIISIHDIGFDSENKVYFTMDYIDGETLTDILKKLNDGDEMYKKSYNLNKLVSMFLNICSAVKYAHSQNIVHLDLKPGNILIGNEENAYVCDWGISEKVTPKHHNENDSNNIYDNSTGINETACLLKVEVNNGISKVFRKLLGRVSGTPGYMAPEQASVEMKQRGRRTDIYALGAILYSMLTYKPSLAGSDLGELVSKTLDGDIVLPSRRAPQNNIPEALETICCKAMDINVKNRYKTVKELITDVRLYLFCGSNQHKNSDIFKKIRKVVEEKRSETMD